MSDQGDTMKERAVVVALHIASSATLRAAIREASPYASLSVEQFVDAWNAMRPTDPIVVEP